MLGRHHGKRLCKQNAKRVMNPGTVEAGGNQQVEKSRWAARQRRGLHMLSGGSWHWDTVPSQYLGTKKAGLSPRGRNKLWKGSNSLRPPSPTEGDLCGQDQWHITAVPLRLPKP